MDRQSINNICLNYTTQSIKSLKEFHFLRQTRKKQNIGCLIFIAKIMMNERTFPKSNLPSEARFRFLKVCFSSLQDFLRRLHYSFAVLCHIFLERPTCRPSRDSGFPQSLKCSCRSFLKCGLSNAFLLFF